LNLVGVGRMLEDKVLVWRFNRQDTAAFCRIDEKCRDSLLKVTAPVKISLANGSAGE